MYYKNMGITRGTQEELTRHLACQKALASSKHHKITCRYKKPNVQKAYLMSKHTRTRPCKHTQLFSPVPIASNAYQMNIQDLTTSIPTSSQQNNTLQSSCQHFYLLTNLLRFD